MLLYDFHSHILPGADHGSSGIETTEKQLDIIKDSGVGAVVATPHFYPHAHSVEDFLDMRRASLESIEDSLLEKGIRLYLGAEVLLCPSMEKMEGLSSLCIEGTDVMLIEMPFAKWTDELLFSLAEIYKMGINPVIAHIDRYNESNIARLFEVVENPMLQLNAESLCVLFEKRKNLKLIEEGRVYAIGSDLHGTKGYNAFLKAIRYIGEENTERIMQKTASLLKTAKAYGKTE
ncbi:MAG: histidinol-phosphatase [Clostridia bacterium]|nr:histidinol-phosphatase [Clostridia bacterium]